MILTDHSPQPRPDALHDPRHRIIIRENGGLETILLPLALDLPLTGIDGESETMTEAEAREIGII